MCGGDTVPNVMSTPSSYTLARYKDAVSGSYEDDHDQEAAHTTHTTARKALMDNELLDITYFKSTYKWVSNFIEDASG